MLNTKSKNKKKILLLFFLLANINALLSVLVIVTTRLAEGEEIKLIFFIIWEFTGSYSFFLLVPVMLYVISKRPFTKNNIFNRIPVYFFTAAILGAVHTAVMYYSRILIFEIAGWGTYYYGYLPYRYIMETLKLGVGFLIVYLVFSFIKSNKEKQEEKLKAVKLEEQLTRTRLEFLKNQIHPHFLFNTLNMISSVMYESVPKADKMIANLSDMLRNTLKTSGAGVHPLKEEIKILQFYLEIMLARFKDKLSIVFNVNDKYFDFPVPSFLLQPLVENSIKYGMESLSFVKIKIDAEATGNKLKITIKDNGPGINVEPEKVFKQGVGISNTQERLEKLYGNNFEFYWQNMESGGLLVTIIIPGDN